MKGILLGKDGDIDIIPRKNKDGGLTGFAVGDTLVQNAAIVLELNQGELKEDPVLGPNLMRFIRSRTNRDKIEKQIKIHLERVGINYSELADLININLKTD